jgi:hypothetical protein
MTKEVIVADGVSKDVTEVDNDRWLVAVPIKDHSGALSTKFPIENRLHPIQTMEDLKDSLSQSGMEYSARLRDFHLLLFLSKHLGTDDLGAFYTLVPIRPRWRGERRSLRTLPGASLRPPLAFNPRPPCLSTPPDAFQLHPAIALYGTTLSRRREDGETRRDDRGGVQDHHRLARGVGVGRGRTRGEDERRDDRDRFV